MEISSLILDSTRRPLSFETHAVRQNTRDKHFFFLLFVRILSVFEGENVEDSGKKFA